ncbi:low-density lipoprotein receptor, partial [Plakobranchus ocellatus]
MQCDYGSVYQPCGNGCPEACGSLNASSNSLCSSMNCMEGCFCPPGTVRSNVLNMADSMCVPVSECPCTDDQGRKVLPGQMLTIDCQTCECANGELVCTGEPCITECHQDDYECSDGRCINSNFKCNGVPDCPDGGDEFDCEDEVCKGFRCNNGQCVGNNTVCDSRMDCLDNSDEELCDVQCQDGDYKCPQSTFCIPLTFVCDGIPDCWYGEEEVDCEVCPKEEVHCNQTYCIPKEFRCDGHDDCGDGSDETGCKCEHVTKTFNSSDRNIFLMADNDLAEKAFTTEGWSPGTGGQEGGNLTISVNSDGTPTLNTVTFDLVGGAGTTISLTIETALGKTYVERILVTKDPLPYVGTFDTEFDKLAIVTSATITNLEVTVCYEPPAAPTTPETPSTPSHICPDGYKDLSGNHFGPPNGIHEYEAGHIPLITVDLRVNENLVQENSTDIFAVSFFVVGIGNYTATVYYYDEPQPVFEELGTSDDHIVYTPPDPVGIERIVFTFLVDDITDPDGKARVEYLGSKGCFQEYICEKGFCGKICMDFYDDPCDSDCAPSHCTTPPLRTTSTIRVPTTTPATTPCAVHLVEELESSFVPPSLGTDNSPLLLEVSSGGYVGNIEVTNVTDDANAAILKPAEEPFVGDGEPKAIIYSKSVILLDILPRGQCITAARYCSTLDRLKEAIRRKRPGFLFGPLKRHLGGMAFGTEDDLISELKNWFDNLDVNFFRNQKQHVNYVSDDTPADVYNYNSTDGSEYIVVVFVSEDTRPYETILPTGFQAYDVVTRQVKQSIRRKRNRKIREKKKGEKDS